jgi:hypothetical protein
MSNDENILIEFTNFLEKAAMAPAYSAAPAVMPPPAADYGGEAQRVAPPAPFAGSTPEGPAASKPAKPAAALSKPKF